MHPKLSFMLEIIQKLGEFQHQYFRTEIEFEEKTRAMDVVSFVDRECEQMFHDALQERFAGDYVMGEETFDAGYDYSQHEKLWIIDPLDGTLMYQRGIPTYGPMIAYVENGVVQCSAIFLPELKELYYADETGAYRNNQKIQVSKIASLKSSLIHVSTGMLRSCFNDDTKYCHFVDSIGNKLTHILVRQTYRFVLLAVQIEVYFFQQLEDYGIRFLDDSLFNKRVEKGLIFEVIHGIFSIHTSFFLMVLFMNEFQKALEV